MNDKNEDSSSDFNYELDSETRSNTIANRAPPPLSPSIEQEGINDSSSPSFPVPKNKVQRTVRIQVSETTPSKEIDSDSLNTTTTTTSSDAKSSLQPLVHFSYTCPGLHDPGSRQLVERWTFARLFSV